MELHLTATETADSSFLWLNRGENNDLLAFIADTVDAI